MQGFFDIPVDNIKTSPLLINYIKANIPNYQSLVVVAKNAGASKRAALIAKRLKLDFAMIYGEQTKFAESLSEEVLYAGDGSLDAASLEASSPIQLCTPERLKFARLAAQPPVGEALFCQLV